MSSLLMKHYGVKQVIVHINSTSFFKVVRRIGIDAVISKNTSAVNKVLKIIRSDEDKLSVSLLHQNIGNHGKSWLWTLISLAPISMRRPREYLPWGFKICAF